MAIASKRYQFISLKNDYAFRELFSYENVRKQFLSDVLEIPIDEIQTVRITNPYLWKRFLRQKLGILDMNMEMQDGTKVDIEMQVRWQEHWVRRRKASLLAFLLGQNVHRGFKGRAGLRKAAEMHQHWHT